MGFQITTLKGPRSRLTLVGGVSGSSIPTRSLTRPELNNDVYQTGQSTSFIGSSLYFTTYELIHDLGLQWSTNHSSGDGDGDGGRSVPVDKWSLFF